MADLAGSGTVCCMHAVEFPTSIAHSSDLLVDPQLSLFDEYSGWSAPSGHGLLVLYSRFNVRLHGSVCRCIASANSRRSDDCRIAETIACWRREHWAHPFDDSRFRLENTLCPFKALGRYQLQCAALRQNARTFAPCRRDLCSGHTISAGFYR